MGNLLGRSSHGRRRARSLGLLLVGSPLLLSLTACGNGDDSSSIADLPPADQIDQEAEPGLRPCAEDRHLAVFDIIGFLTEGNLEVLTPWQQGTPPEPRVGGAELVQAHRQKGFEILYVTTIPPDFFGERSVEEVVDEWLLANGFPLDAGTHFWGSDGQFRPDQETWVSITDELLRYASEGVSVDRSYTENTDKTYAFATGGVPPEGNFSLTPIEGLGQQSPTSAPTTLIPNDDLVAHTQTVHQLAPICQVA